MAFPRDMASQRAAAFASPGNMGTVIDFADALNMRHRLMDTMQQTPGIVASVLAKENTVYVMQIILNYIFKSCFSALLTPEHVHHADFIKQVLHSMLWLGYAAITRDKHGRLICVPPTEYTVLSRQEYKNVFGKNRYSGLAWREPFEEYRCIFVSDRAKQSYSFTGFGPPIVLISPFNRPPIAGVPCAPVSMFDWISPIITLFYQSTLALFVQSACRDAYTPTGSIPTMSAFVKAAGTTQMGSTHNAISEKFAKLTQDSMNAVNQTARSHLRSIEERIPNVDDLLRTNVTPVDSTHIAFAPVVAPTEARMTPVDRMDAVVLNAYGISPSWLNLGHSSDRSAHINLSECTARAHLNSTVRMVTVIISQILDVYALNTGHRIPFISGDPTKYPMDVETILELSHLLKPECTGRLLQQATFGQITPDDIRLDEVKSVMDKRRPLDPSS